MSFPLSSFSFIPFSLSLCETLLGNSHPEVLSHKKTFFNKITFTGFRDLNFRLPISNLSFFLICPLPSANLTHLIDASVNAVELFSMFFYWLLSLLPTTNRCT